MDKQLEQYFEDQFQMFSEQGWKDFTEEATKLRDSLNSLDQVVSTETLWLRKGQIDMLNWIINRQVVVTSTYQDNLDE